MPVYNAGGSLLESIPSVQVQSMPDWELIVLDDGSSDNSPEQLRRFASKDRRISVFRKENDANFCTARNMKLMLQKAEGEFCFYMSQDDVISPDLFEKAMERAAEASLDVVVPDMLLRFSDERIEETCGSHPPGDNYDAILSGREAFYHSIDFTVNGFAFFRRELMEQNIPDTNNFDADEFNTRLQFLAARRVGFCHSTFFYNQTNDTAITKRFSMRWFERLNTVRALDRVCCQTFNETTVFAKDSDRGANKNEGNTVSNQQDISFSQEAILKSKTWMVKIYAALMVEYLNNKRRITPPERHKAAALIKDFEHNATLKGYKRRILGRLNTAERLFAVWFFVFGTCRSMAPLHRIYRLLKSLKAFRGATSAVSLL